MDEHDRGFAVPQELDPELAGTPRAELLGSDPIPGLDGKLEQRGYDLENAPGLVEEGEVLERRVYGWLAQTNQCAATELEETLERGPVLRAFEENHRDASRRLGKVSDFIEEGGRSTRVGQVEEELRCLAG